MYDFIGESVCSAADGREMFDFIGEIWLFRY